MIQRVSFGRIVLLMTVMSVSACQTGNQETPGKAALSTATPEATEAGMAILSKGGNAVDAAVAVSFVLGVTEPAMSGLGGGTQILLAMPGQSPVAINGATLSPALTPIEAERKDLDYHRRSTIPSTVKVLQYVFKKYGSGNLGWEELLAPAIRFAEEGFPMGLFRHKVYQRYQKALSRSPHHTHLWLLPDGQIPAPGDVLQQPVLANTLRRLANHGGDDFYHGEIARQIAADMAANNGWITLADLEAFPDPVELPALYTSFRDFDVFSQPPPCGGWTVLLALNLLEIHPPTALRLGTESRHQKVLQALHLAHRDRREKPVTDLVNYEAAVSRKLDKAYARSLLAERQEPSTPSNVQETGGETTHFSIVDDSGLAIAVTASINAYFGAKAAAPELGFLYNTYMDDFVFGEPDHPFAIRGGLMNYSSMSPTIVQRDGKTVLVIGSPGSARIISAVSQLVQLWVDSDLGLEAVVALPRLHSVRQRIYLEDPGIPVAWLQHFRDLGFEIAFPGYDLELGGLNAYFGGVHAVALEELGWSGVADPRRDGRAAVLRQN